MNFWGREGGYNWFRDIRYKSVHLFLVYEDGKEILNL